MAFDLSETLCKLVSIPSVNPMGRTVSGPEFLETRLTDCLETVFAEMGLPCVRQPVSPGRDNLIARLDGQTPPEQGGGLILFEAHQDTVPVDGMTIEPFRPQQRDGRIYGRGTCDVKGGMTAMLAALDRLARERPPDMPTILMACTVNEEHGFTGARALCTLWQTAGVPLVSRRPDAAIVAEPTGLNVVVAHKGALRWRCHATGRAAHSAAPDQGENAIYRMARAILALERYGRDVVGQLASHPLCGRPTLSVGTIHGGLSVNTVPDRCTIEIDRRLVPGEQPEPARAHLVDWLAANSEVGPYLVHDSPFIQGPPLGDETNAALAARLVETATEVTGGSRPTGVPYGTDAAALAASGVPSVVFGPGSIQQAHTVDEWLSLDELEQAAEIFYRFGRRGLAG